MKMAQIQKLWDFFILAENSSYEKSTWWDIFLCQFILSLYNGNPIEEILSFCNYNEVGTLIGCELLSNINQICSQPKDGDDLRPLKQYFVGKAWKAIVVLISLGPQNSSCSSELADLFISLFPVCFEENDWSKATFTKINKYIPENKNFELDSLLTLSAVNSKNYKPQGHESSKIGYFKSLPALMCIRSKRQVQRIVYSKQNDINSSESENICDNLNAFDKSGLLKIKFDLKNVNYFTKAMRSKSDNKLNRGIYTPEQKPKSFIKISPFDFLDEKIKDVMFSQVSSYELCMLIIQLLTSLCASENSFAEVTEISCSISFKSAKFALENLCSHQFDFTFGQSVNATDLKCALTQLLIICLKKLFCRLNVITNVILTGILPMTLKVLDDSIFQLSNAIKNPEFCNSDSFSYEKEKQHQIIFGLMCSVLSFFYNLLAENPDIYRFQSFSELFKMLIGSNNGKLIKKTIKTLVKCDETIKAKRVIELLGQLIIIFKKVRIDVSNPHLINKRFKSPKNKSEYNHYSYYYYNFYHHHLFENAFSNSALTSVSSQNCHVSRLFLALFKLLDKPYDMPLKVVNQILRVMKICGTCCCLSSINLLKPFIEIIKLPFQKTRHLVFQLLETTIYPELGCYAISNAEMSSLMMCSNKSSKTVKERNQMDGNICEFCNVDSAPSGFNFDLESFYIQNPAIQFDLFNNLLSLNDFKTVQQVTIHLLKCAPKMSNIYKRIVLFDIFLPHFLENKKKYFLQKDEISTFKIISCLSLFSSLLYNSGLAKIFIIKKGINHVLDLLSVTTFTRHCCSVVEKVIFLYTYSSENDLSNVLPLVVLKNVVNEANLLFLKYFGDTEKNNYFHPLNFKIMSKKITAEEKEELSQHKINVLNNVCALWKTYANLALQNPNLKKYFSQTNFQRDSNKLMKVALIYLTNEDVSGNKLGFDNNNFSAVNWCIKLIESLLMFILAISDKEENEIEEENEKNNFIFQKLFGNFMVDNFRRVDIRKLAEILLKCSLIQRTQFQATPIDSLLYFQFNTFKNFYEEICRDVDVLEERLLGESETEDYDTDDEGYDADTEFRESVISPGDLININFKECSSKMDDIFPQKIDILDVKYSQKNCHIIAYPSLCILALDLLIKLYQENSMKHLTQTDKNDLIISEEDYIIKNETKHLSSVGKQKNYLDIVSQNENNASNDKALNLPDKRAKEKNTYDVKWRIFEPQVVIDNEDKFIDGLVSVFQKLISLCQNKFENCVILCKNKVIFKLLCGFHSCFTEKKKSLMELQKVILDLVTILAKHSITPEELSIYFDFFKYDNPPLDYLLVPLLNLVACHTPQPNRSLCFPAHSTSKNFLSYNHADLEKKFFLPKTEGIESCWSAAAILLPIESKWNWSAWSQGFSLSIWLKIEKVQSEAKLCDATQNYIKGNRKFKKTDKSPVCDTFERHVSEIRSNENVQLKVTKVPSLHFVHVFSLGNPNMTLECWNASIFKSFTWRLSKIDNDKKYVIIAEKTVKHNLLTSLWSHMAVNIRILSSQKKTVLEIGLLTDGKKENIILLPVPCALSRKLRGFSLLLGAKENVHKKGLFCFGNLKLFASPILTREKSIYLLGLGPNCISLMENHICHRKPNFTSIFPNQSPMNDINWEAVLDSKCEIIQCLQANLFLTYSAENPFYFNIYSVSFSGNTGHFFPSRRQFNFRPKAIQKPPVSIKSYLLASLNQFHYQGLIPSAYILGGSATFMFLFGRVVEISNDPEEQGKFLFLLLKFVQSDSDLFTQFIECDHHNMLHKIFSVSKCCSGLYILKAILDACCDKPIIKIHGNQFEIINQSNSIMVNSFLIPSILKFWKYWTPTLQTNEALELLLLSLLTLVADENPFREFNVYQLKRVQIINNLFFFCKERLLYDDVKTITQKVAFLIVELVKSLMSAPPEFNDIASVMHFLILLHPVNTTFVTHIKNSFYPLLPVRKTNRSIQGEPESESLDLRPHRLSENWIKNINFSNRLKKLRNNFNSARDLNHSTKAFAKLQQNLSENENFDVLKGENRSEKSSKKTFSSDFINFNEGIDDNIKSQVASIKQEEIVFKFDDIKQQIKKRDKKMSSFFFNIAEESYRNVNCIKSSYSEDLSKKLEILNNRECHSIITENLLLLLRDILTVVPDSMAHQVLNHIIKPEILLVFANQKDPQVRSAVVKVFSSYLQRCSSEEKNKFIKLKGFYHLANQLSLFPASGDLLENCLNLITDHSNYSVENHDVLANQQSPLFGVGSFSILLALLPRCVHDLSLAHNLINMICRSYSKDENMSKIFFEIGLLESLMKTLVSLIHFDFFETSNSYQSLLMMDLYNFFVVILHGAINTPGVVNTQIFTDILLELQYILELEKDNCGLHSKCFKSIRDLLFKIMKEALDLTQKKMFFINYMEKSKVSIWNPTLNGNCQTSSKVEKNHSNGFAAPLRVSSSSVSKNISKSEFSKRLKLLVSSVIDFLVFSGNLKNCSVVLSPTEISFIHYVFPLLLRLMSENIENSNISDEIFWAVKESLKAEVFKLLAWLISPRQTLKIRTFALSVLVSQTNSKILLSTFLQISDEAELEFSAYLSDLMCNNQLGSVDLKNCLYLAKNLDQKKIILPNTLVNHTEYKCLKTSCDTFLADFDKLSDSWQKGIINTAVRCVQKYDGLLKGISENALLMTLMVVNVQNSERKLFIETMKLHDSENVHLMSKWNSLIERITHEKAVWHFENAYPMFWELDSTEGPSRVRKRLSRCHLDVDEKYFLHSEREKLNKCKMKYPLAYLFQDFTNNHSTTLIEKLHCHEKIRSMFSAIIITPAAEISGELLLGKTSIYFVADVKQMRHSMDSLHVSNATWSFRDVKQIYTRRFQLQERAIELFLMSGKTYFIAFDSCENRNIFLMHLSECEIELPNKVNGDNLTNIMQLWREGHITNWEYLTHLNQLAGRSYNDLMQYPVYPFVLSDYRSPTLDLNNKKVYRNLSKPMAVQDKKNEQHYINNYHELLGGLKQVSLNKEPYHYGSHYSNSGTVLHFLVRLPPFTKLLLQYQDRNFDLPDRTFHSMNTTWMLASSESTTDVKEMIPEFFFLPEFLINFQRFNFGIRQSGEPVNDVLLPPWCTEDPRKFILIHRQALESDYVTKHLPHWIDLVFGYKQTGKAAVEAINVFHPATYSGFNVASITDPVEKIAWETMVKTYGQTPKQLFNFPHPLATRPLVSSVISLNELDKTVKGLKWGRYVGSPVASDPIVVSTKIFKSKEIIADLVPLATNDVLGIPSFSTPLVQYNKDKCPSLVNANGIQVALVSWKYTDGVVRVKIKKDMPAVPLVSTSAMDPVTLCSTAPGCNHLWMGHLSGNLTVFKFDFALDQDHIDYRALQNPIVLQGHKNAVTQIRISPAYSVVITSDLDGEVIIWDLNSVTYVRNLGSRTGPVKAVAISETLGDIASTALSTKSTASKNILRLHTINAAIVNSVIVDDTITSMCFSTAPEGVSINVIACGLSSGAIRLFSAWDLTRLRDINNPSLGHSLINLAYTNDSSQLYASYSDGTVAVWENPGKKCKIKSSKLLCAVIE